MHVCCYFLISTWNVFMNIHLLFAIKSEAHFISKFHLQDLQIHRDFFFASMKSGLWDIWEQLLDDYSLQMPTFCVASSPNFFLFRSKFKIFSLENHKYDKKPVTSHHLYPYNPNSCGLFYFEVTRFIWSLLSVWLKYLHKTIHK